MEILYTDRNMAVCIKPVGVSSEDGPGSLPELLRGAMGGEVYPIHRLDLNVGGVMVYARNRATAAFLSQAVAQRQLKKEYLALCHGTPEEAGNWEDLLWKDSRKNKVYVVQRQRQGVKKASLEYEILGRTPEFSLARILLHTGRSHQIRVQFASRGFPLLGDGKYGARDKIPFPALWFYRLTIPQKSGPDLVFSALPQGTVWDLIPLPEK